MWIFHYRNRLLWFFKRWTCRGTSRTLASSKWFRTRVWSIRHRTGAHSRTSATMRASCTASESSAARTTTTTRAWQFARHATTLSGITRVETKARRSAYPAGRESTAWIRFAVRAVTWCMVFALCPIIAHVGRAGEENCATSAKFIPAASTATATMSRGSASVISTGAAYSAIKVPTHYTGPIILLSTLQRPFYEFMAEWAIIIKKIKTVVVSDGSSALKKQSLCNF